MQTRLFDAVDRADVGAVAALLAAGVQPDDDINADGDYPLQVAARLGGIGGLEIVKLLVNAGAQIDYEGDFNCTALHRAVQHNHGDNWATARWLVKNKASVSCYNKDGLTPPELAVAEEFDDAVLAMLEEGMTPNVFGFSANLIGYVAWSSPQLVKELIKRGANVNVSSRWGETPLHRAAESYHAYSEPGHLSARTRAACCAYYLIEAGADRTAVNDHGKTPADLAGLIAEQFLADAEMGYLEFTTQPGKSQKAATP